ncbi:hypothetical protein B0T24DRAFT_665745 [Lasiosphaeria ovina]|uniref:Uncharacterized protein n=1 Tax=Lasiosphaeria ovina TaxID=92902 RepID=A0AAE0KIK2_9PEZI|nr:hypothetical protein B0T24DRAFT_665745 [Lasiosphaeria ovina]
MLELRSAAPPPPQLLPALAGGNSGMETSSNGSYGYLGADLEQQQQKAASTRTSINDRRATSRDTSRLADRGSAQAPPPPSPQPWALQRKRTRLAPAWAVALLALGTTAVTVWYSQRVMVDRTELPSSLRLSPGLTVLAVNVLSHIVAFLVFSLCGDVLEQVRWAFACRPEGVLLTSFLAMSRATPVGGVLYLCRVRGWHQLWALQRILSYIITAALSLVLIANVTFKVVYTPFSSDSSATRSVVGGLAPLDTSGLADVDIALIPLLASAYSIGFITDPRYVTKVAPVGCSASDPNCVSLLMPGGMEVVRTYENPSGDSASQSLYSGNFTGDYDSIVINDAPAYHIEYSAIGPDFQWNRTDPGGDCTMYGGDISEGVYVCQREVGDGMYFGWAICPDEGVAAKTCQTSRGWTDAVAWNTTVSLFSRQATVAYDRNNMSILSVERVSDAQPTKIDGAVAALYMNVILQPITPTLNWTADNSTYSYSAARFGFTYGISFLLRLYTSDYSTYRDGGVYLLRSLVAVPFQFATAMRQYGHVNLMPAANSVTATLSQSAYRALIDGWTVWVFAWLAFPTVAYCVALLAWMSVAGPYSPNISVFPELDITSKSSSSLHTQPGRGSFASDMDPHLEMAEHTLEDLGRLTRSRGMGGGSSARIVQSIRGRRVWCGSLPGASGNEQYIVLLTEEAGRLRCLNRETRYS